MTPIWVDFNTAMQDEEGRVYIPKGEVKPYFRPGLRITIRDETLQVEATLEPDREHHEWWARPDWRTRRDLPYSPP